MISITNQIADINGYVSINEDQGGSDFNSHTARVVRSKTLDGGVHISQPSFVDGDRTFTVKANITEEEEDSLLYLKDQGFLYLSCERGFFSCVIEKISCLNGALNMSIFINERLDQE